VNVDTSAVVIRQMTAKSKGRPGLSFEQQDATSTSFESDHFSVIVDKGTLDALMFDPSEESEALGRKLLKVCNRELENVHFRPRSCAVAISFFSGSLFPLILFRSTIAC
jgi:hypothetical protein